MSSFGRLLGFVTILAASFGATSAVAEDYCQSGVCEIYAIDTEASTLVPVIEGNFSHWLLTEKVEFCFIGLALGNGEGARLALYSMLGNTPAISMATAQANAEPYQSMDADFIEFSFIDSACYERRSARIIPRFTGGGFKKSEAELSEAREACRTRGEMYRCPE